MTTSHTIATVEQSGSAAWAVDHFTTFWAEPDPAGDTSHLAPDIVGYWPDGHVLRGIAQYRGRLMKLGGLIPDLRLDVLEYAINDDLAFIRWRGHGTGSHGAFELFGLDRLRVRGDQIVENIVHFDTATFEAATGVSLSSA